MQSLSQCGGPGVAGGWQRQDNQSCARLRQPKGDEDKEAEGDDRGVEGDEEGSNDQSRVSGVGPMRVGIRDAGDEADDNTRVIRAQSAIHNPRVIGQGRRRSGRLVVAVIKSLETLESEGGGWTAAGSLLTCDPSRTKQDGRGTGMRGRATGNRPAIGQVDRGTSILGMCSQQGSLGSPLPHKEGKTRQDGRTGEKEERRTCPPPDIAQPTAHSAQQSRQAQTEPSQLVAAKKKRFGSDHLPNLSTTCEIERDTHHPSSHVTEMR
ncbi:hypothetical protein F4802DRAFT_597803 [Xylaria palmicola]|nr:hypothetical protein F4802DRAFT_597803 [Xylaria palmicola]